MMGKLRAHWLAVHAGALLLLASWMELRLCQGLRAWAPPTPAVEAGLGLRERIAHRLLTWNPRIGDATAGRIADAVLRCEREHRLNPALVLAVIKVESSGRPSARSYKGAIGLMQVMPNTFETLALPGAVSHIESNVEAGCMVLADNIRRLGEERGILSYFWGGRIGGRGYLDRVRTVQRQLGGEIASLEQGRG
jgi:soluble lytic murein transglycosylase-like protein